MRVKLAILIFALCAWGATTAQNVAIGERVPKVKSFQYTIDKGEYLYMGFVHSPSRPCEISAPKISELINSFDQISAVLFTREQQGECEQWLIDAFLNGSQVQMGADEIFQKFGVDYAPYGVILDYKRRALWQGNPQTLDKTKIDNILQQWTSQK
jgi:hypothetical protein